MPTPDNCFTFGSNVAYGTSALRVAHCQWSFAVDGGAISTITPLNNAIIPINAVVYNVSINSTTALVGASGTIAVGTSAGSSTTSLVGATAVASYGTNAKVQGTPVPQTASTWFKMTAAGQITITIATTPMSAGVLELYVFYFESST